jgi:hypothetical protein
MSHARKCLEAIEDWGITKFWTGNAYIWEVPRLDENGCHDSVCFDSEGAAQAYVDALKAVVAAEAAVVIPSREVLEELDRLGCEAFWRKYPAG